MVESELFREKVIHDYTDRNPIDYIYDAKTYIENGLAQHKATYFHDWNSRRATAKITLDKDVSFEDYVVQLHNQDSNNFNTSYPFPGVTQGLLTGHKLVDNTEVKFDDGTWEFVDFSNLLRFTISGVVVDLKFEDTKILDG